MGSYFSMLQEGPATPTALVYAAMGRSIGDATSYNGISGARQYTGQNTLSPFDNSRSGGDNYGGFSDTNNLSGRRYGAERIIPLAGKSN